MQHLQLIIFPLQSCKEKTGASAHSVMKYIVKKYPNLEKRKFLLKKALKRQLEKGTVKQVSPYHGPKLTMY